MSFFGDDDDEEMVEEQRAERDHGRNLQAASGQPGMFDGDGRMKRAVVRELTQPDLSDAAAGSLSELLTKDFVLGNLDEAEVHEIKWMARQMRLELEDIHPHPESVWQGEFGQFFFEKDKPMPSQSDLDKLQMEQLLLDVSARAARGRDGFATRQLNTSINVSERRDGDGGDGGGGWL